MLIVIVIVIVVIIVVIVIVIIVIIVVVIRMFFAAFFPFVIIVIVIVVDVIRMLFAALFPFFPTSFTLPLLAAWFADRRWVGGFRILIAAIGVALFSADPTSCWRPSTDSTSATAAMTSLLVKRIVANSAFLRTFMMYFNGTFVVVCWLFGLVGLGGLCWFVRFWILIAAIGVALFPTNPTFCWGPSTYSALTAAAMAGLLVRRIIADPAFLRASFVHFNRTMPFFAAKLFDLFYKMASEGGGEGGVAV